MGAPLLNKAKALSIWGWHNHQHAQYARKTPRFISGLPGYDDVLLKDVLMEYGKHMALEYLLQPTFLR